MKDVIYYVPHQDDEVTNFGVSVINHLAEGYRVHLVLCTDGSASRIKQVLRGEAFCEWHQCVHHHPLTDKEFVSARNREFLWSAGCLGVPSERVYMEQSVKDGELTVAHGLQLIRKYAARFPDARHITFTYQDIHPDHANLGKALLQLCQAGELTEARFQIKHVEAHQYEGIVETCSNSMYLSFLNAANQCYRVFQPVAGLYAIGYHSVPNSFDGQFKQPQCKYHLYDASLESFI